VSIGANTMSCVNGNRRTTVARKRLDAVNTNLDLVNDNMRHFLAQIDQVRTVAKVSAEVDMVWPNIEMLQKSYFRRSSVDDYGDGQDRTTSPNGNDRSIMMNVRTNPPKRKGTLSNPLPSLFNYGIKPWPRRSSLDPSGSTRVDPIRRLELTVGNVRGQRETLIRRRGETTRELQSMIGRIDALIRQKDAVRTWTKAALEQNRSLQHTVDTLLRQIRGDSRARMGRVKDRIYDTLVRRLLSPLFRGVFGVFYMGRWVWSLRSPHSRGERYRGLRNAPWGVWGFGAVMVGLVAFFYYIGG